MKIQVFRTSADEPVTFVTRWQPGGYWLHLQSRGQEGLQSPLVSNRPRLLTGATALHVTKGHATPGLSVTFERTGAGILMRCERPKPPDSSSPTTPTGSGLASWAKASGRWISSFWTRHTPRLTSWLEPSPLPSRPGISKADVYAIERLHQRLHSRTGPTGPGGDSEPSPPSPRSAPRAPRRPEPPVDGRTPRPDSTLSFERPQGWPTGGSSRETEVE